MDTALPTCDSRRKPSCSSSAMRRTRTEVVELGDDRRGLGLQQLLVGRARGPRIDRRNASSLSGSPGPVMSRGVESWTSSVDARRPRSLGSGTPCRPVRLSARDGERVQAALHRRGSPSKRTRNVHPLLAHDAAWRRSRSPRPGSRTGPPRPPPAARELVTCMPAVRARPSAPRSARRCAGAACTASRCGRRGALMHRERLPPRRRNGPHGALCAPRTVPRLEPPGMRGVVDREARYRPSGPEPGTGRKICRCTPVAAPGTVGQFPRARRRPAVGRSAARDGPRCPVPLLDLLRSTTNTSVSFG
jgi:hypothetical protein